MMKKITAIVIALCLGLQVSFAQSKPIIVQGTVLENSSKAPVEFATVVLKNKDNDQLITGATTDIEGKFTLKSADKNFYIELSFIGFASKTIKDFDIQNNRLDLGDVLLSEDGELLDAVEVTAEKSKTVFKLDKRVFNVGSDLSSTGASALEVLNNVPSVNVDIEGQITLRGSGGVQTLINGKPSILSADGTGLGTITADMIEKIEVITNPSAKYDAEGTSGIINIVLKKDEKKGLNGSITLNTGFPQNHSIGLSLNRRTEKFNLFTQLGAGYRSMPREGENINTNKIANTSLYSEGTSYRNEQFYNFILGADYHIDKNNVLTLSGNFAYEIEEQPSETSFRFLDASDAVTSAWDRTENTEATNPKWQYELQYKRDFEDHKEHDFLFSAIGNFFGKDQSSIFENIATIGSIAFGDQNTRTKFQEAKYTFNADYTKPFSKTFTLETGAQYVIQDVSNDFATSDYIDNEWVDNPALTNIFDYNQKVLGTYVTAAYEKDKWGLKLGARLENTVLNTLLETTGEKNDQNYTNFFPSAHTSYKFSERFSMQAGYSKRIYRPRLWDLNPFFNIRNNFNIRTGNPNLQPEFTDSYELTGIYILDEITMNMGIYHRLTNDVIERITTFENDISTTIPSNIGTNKSTGLEFNAKYSPIKWLTFNGDFNYNLFFREGTFEGTSFDFDADQWSTKLMSKIKLPGALDVEITGRYQSRVETVQGERSPNLFADIGMRKKMLKGRAILSLSVRDIFASRFRENIVDQEDYYIYSFGQRGRFISLGFSYGFGKGEAMEFKGRRR